MTSSNDWFWLSVSLFTVYYDTFHVVLFPGPRHHRPSDFLRPQFPISLLCGLLRCEICPTQKLQEMLSDQGDPALEGGE